MHPTTAASRPAAWLRPLLAMLLAGLAAACGYRPTRETATPMSPHFARVYVTENLLHNPRNFRPARFNDYSGQILSVQVGEGRLRIAAANRTVDLALAELDPQARGSRVYLVPDLALVFPSSDAPRLADALFTLKQAALRGEPID